MFILSLYISGLMMARDWAETCNRE
jgi:hypothetical protein